MLETILKVIAIVIIVTCLIMLTLLSAAVNKPTPIIFTPELFLFMGISGIFLTILMFRESA